MKLYTGYPIVARRAWPAGCRVRQASKGILHTIHEWEHTEPLFKLNNILCLYNIYTYHSFKEAFKILKIRLPTALYSEHNSGVQTS